MKAVAPEVGARYQRASDLLSDLLGRPRRRRTTPRDAAPDADGAAGCGASPEDVQDIHTRLRARETPQPRFCWHCRKPLHADLRAARFVAKRSRC